ncbi:hypothetical protein AMTRI_Chr09g32500 [Amborella trichopoda]
MASFKKSRFLSITRRLYATAQAQTLTLENTIFATTKSLTQEQQALSATETRSPTLQQQTPSATEAESLTLEQQAPSATEADTLILEEQTNITLKNARSRIRSAGSPEEAFEVFRKASKSPRFRHDRAAFSAFVQKLAGYERFDLIEQALESHKKPPFSLMEGFIIRLILLYSEAGMVDKALDTFYQMDELECPRSEKSFSATLSGLLSNKRFDDVHRLFDEIPSKFGISPTVFTYDIIIRAFCEEHLLDSAFEMLGKMEKIGIKPDVVSYNTLIDGFLRAGDQTRVDELLKEMTEKGCAPDLVTYNLRILGFCKDKESVKAQALLEEMRSRGIRPNSRSYNAVIFGFYKEGNLEEARRVYESIPKGDESPNSGTYFMLIQFEIEHGNYETALELCKKSIKRKWIPPFFTMKSLIDGLVKISKVDEAKAIVEEMKKKFSGSAADSWMKVETTISL